MAAPLAAESTRRFVIEALRARQREPRLLLLGLPAPALPLEPLWAALPTEPAVLWDPPDSAQAADAQVGLGEVTASGLSPWTRSARAGQSPPPVERLAPAGQPLPGALCWLGALRFADAAQAPPWRELANETLRLPRWRYARGPAGCSLHLAVYAPTESLIEQIDAELVALHRASALLPAAADAPTPVAVRHEALPQPLWQQWIGRILQAIDEGLVQKVVAARHSTVGFARPIAVPDVLARLRLQAPQSFRFALRRGASTFLGATPERLLRKRGREVTTEALAGTRVRDETPLPELTAQLLASAKERHEHELVVSAITERLSRLCDVSTDPQQAAPQVRALPHLLHLCTPIHATTQKSSTHILELLQLLHPTPAVAGTPTEEALKLIAACEPQARGHYAGPVGYCDEHGDGEFAVAIRSGVVIADTAFIYGGAGIVRGSDAGREYAETAAKMRPLLDALAAPPAPPAADPW